MSALTIPHTSAEGTLIDGTARGDDSAPVLKANGWRWGRSLGCWFHPPQPGYRTQAHPDRHYSRSPHRRRFHRRDATSMPPRAAVQRTARGEAPAEHRAARQPGASHRDGVTMPEQRSARDNPRR